VTNTDRKELELRRSEIIADVRSVVEKNIVQNSIGMCWSELDPIRGTTSRLNEGVISPAVVLQKSSRLLLLLLLLWVCGFALSKRGGISTVFAAASILSIPARHTAIGIWLFIA
jgi:hypothetical protein